MIIFLQLFVIFCFTIVIIALFREKTDFLTYSVAAMLAAATATFLFSPTPFSIEEFILAIDWPVIFFLISLFTIVVILEEQLVFQEVALRITKKFSTNTRKFFWVICLISTLSAAFIEDVSVAIIFIPMIVSTSEKMRINPAPILLGMTICINLAATLTPFGSAQNILIANEFNLSTSWFFSNIAIYFIIGTLLTLFLLDKFVLRKHLDEIWVPHCNEFDEPLETQHLEEHELILLEEPIPPKVFYRNLGALIVFFVLLIIIPDILFVGILGMLLFVFMNPRRSEAGSKKPDVSYYFRKVDFKLPFFFITLFILIFCFEKVGITDIMNNFIVNITPGNLFLTCILVLILTSVLSGFLDNVPVTVLFIPIIHVLTTATGLNLPEIPIYIAFILGINLGGNFLPQGSAADMMTLELSTKYCVDGMNYRKLLKIGGLFALFHIILGIFYLGVIIFLFFP
ncbi:MAG: SLC13 family permease [Promethearchaeota archaeon]|jgi:Na+/H+ antiporter NhaD/arsenite permease-like protein